VPHWQNWVV